MNSALEFDNIITVGVDRVATPYTTHGYLFWGLGMSQGKMTILDFYLHMTDNMKYNFIIG